MADYLFVHTLTRKQNCEVLCVVLLMFGQLRPCFPQGEPSLSPASAYTVTLKLSLLTTKLYMGHVKRSKLLICIFITGHTVLTADPDSLSIEYYFVSVSLHLSFEVLVTVLLTNLTSQ